LASPPFACCWSRSALLCVVSVPLSASAWTLGRRARRRGVGGSSRGLGAAGEVLGVIGALLGGLALTWWTAVVLGLRAL
jgi:hypothetical protein